MDKFVIGTYMNVLAAVYCENEIFGLAENTYIEMLRLLNDNRYADIVAEKKELFIINANSMLCIISCLKGEIDKSEYYGKSCLDLLDNNDRLKKNAIAYDLCVKSCLALADTYLVLKQKKDAERWSEYGLKYVEMQRENDSRTENTNNHCDSLVRLNKKSKKMFFRQK